MYLRRIEDQQVFINSSLSSPSGSALLVVSTPKRSIGGPRAKMDKDCPQTQHTTFLLGWGFIYTGYFMGGLFWSVKTNKKIISQVS